MQTQTDRNIENKNKITTKPKLRTNWESHFLLALNIIFKHTKFILKKLKLKYKTIFFAIFVVLLRKTYSSFAQTFIFASTFFSNRSYDVKQNEEKNQKKS